MKTSVLNSALDRKDNKLPIPNPTHEVQTASIDNYIFFLLMIAVVLIIYFTKARKS